MFTNDWPLVHGITEHIEADVNEVYTLMGDALWSLKGR